MQLIVNNFTLLAVGMQSFHLVFITLALASCTDQQSGDQGRKGMNNDGNPRSTVKIPATNPELLARRRAAMHAAYSENGVSEGRIFGTRFEDVWWEQPLANKIKRISTGDIFESADYNGGYPSYFILKHGDQLLRGEYKKLYVDEHRYEPIVMVGPARNYGREDPARRDRRWTADELHLIASFFQTHAEIMRESNIASAREHGFHETAVAIERMPKMKVSVVFDEQGLISRLTSLFWTPDLPQEGGV
jgi:hypothetical protein